MKLGALEPNDVAGILLLYERHCGHGGRDISKIISRTAQRACDRLQSNKLAKWRFSSRWEAESRLHVFVNDHDDIDVFFEPLVDVESIDYANVIKAQREFREAVLNFLR